MNGLARRVGRWKARSPDWPAQARRGRSKRAGARRGLRRAPETRRGSPTSAPATKTRSVMDRTRPRMRRAFRAPGARLHYAIKVTNLRRGFLAAPAGAVSPITPLGRKCKGRREGRPLRCGEALLRLLDAGRKPVAARAPEAGEAKTADAERHQRPRRRFRRRCISRPPRRATRPQARRNRPRSQ